MSAECSKCGSDLAYDLSCSRCEWEQRALAAEAEVERLRAIERDYLRCESENVDLRAARDSAEAERDEWRAKAGDAVQRDRLAVVLRELREAILGFPLGGDEPRRARVRDACMAAEAALSILDRETR